MSENITEVQEPVTWELTPGEYEATREKIARISARAAKRGFTGGLAAEGTRRERTRQISGFDVTDVVYDTVVTGTPPSYNGWTLLATLEWDASAGLIARTLPGVDSVDRSRFAEGKCDHCRTSRARRKFFAVSDGTRQLQVGSTCLKDFLGWDATVVFRTAQDVRDEVDGYLAGGYYQPDWATETVLAAAWAAIQAHGFEPADSYGATTKGRVQSILDPRSASERQAAREYEPYVRDAAAQAAIIRAWVLSDDFSGASEYVTNLKAIAAADFTSARSIGFLASAPQAWARAQERDLVRRREADQIVNEFAGEVGDKIEADVTIKSIRYHEGQFGTTTIYTLVSADGHVFKWFASRSALGDTADGKVRTIKGTVKGHDEYHDIKSTVLTRCRAA